MKKNKHKLLITFIVLVQCLGYSQRSYFPYREGNLWGFCDESAQIILQPTFTNIERSIYEKGYYEISNGEKKGLFYNSKIIIPAEYKNNHEAYIRQIVDEMLPVIAKEGLADFIDVFCERNYFSLEEMEEILLAGAKYGLVPKAVRKL